MEEHSGRHLQVLGQLAREYQQKYAELEAVLRGTQSDMVMQQLRRQGELTTDRFRGAQQTLFSLLSLADDSENAEEMMKALTALCRGFDEMRILFQVLLDYAAPPTGEGENSGL